LARQLREKGTIVSSDREVRDSCRVSGCVVLGAQVFDERLGDSLSRDGALRRVAQIDADKDGDADDAVSDRGEKRGNPRRLPKSERKTRRRLDRL
jgi:hypothetical protein